MSSGRPKLSPLSMTRTVHSKEAKIDGPVNSNPHQNTITSLVSLINNAILKGHHECGFSIEHRLWNDATLDAFVTVLKTTFVETFKVRYQPQPDAFNQGKGVSIYLKWSSKK